MSDERIEPAGYCLAQQVERPLLVRRASDILSKWGDEAEKKWPRISAGRRRRGDPADCRSSTDAVVPPGVGARVA